MVKGRGAKLLGISFLFLLLISSAPSASAFVLITNGGQVARWSNPNLSYYFHDIPEDFEDSLHTSFEVWEEISGIDLRINFEGAASAASRDSRSTLRWVTEGWSSLSFRPPSNALAVTLSSFSASSGEIVDADIYFNAENFDWGVVESEEDFDLVDVQNIATHEIGHLIGLDHSSVNYFETEPDLANATMYYASGAGETSRRVPQIDDIRGVRSLYASGAAESLGGVPEIHNAEALEVLGRTVIYRIQGKNFSEYTSFILSSGSMSAFDSVSRYRTILSSSEAEVEFNLSGFGSTNPNLIAFNGFGSVSAVQVQLEEDWLDPYALAANASSGGGGGCSAKPGAAGNADLVLVMGFLILLGLHSRVRRVYEYARRAYRRRESDLLQK